jgi:hypothetical protein
LDKPKKLLIAIKIALIITEFATPIIVAGAEPKRSKEVTLKATWYCGKSQHTRGAGGRLVSGKSIALNNKQRKALGLRYGDKVYVRAPAAYKITGWKVVMDTGCRYGVLDAYYVRRTAVPAKFRRAGVVEVKMLISE